AKKMFEKFPDLKNKLWGTEFWTNGYFMSTVGYRILFLPTYSPDLNPIEHYWFKIKNEIRKVMGQFKDISMAVEHVLKFI
ncbi:MAG: transposase, partial [Rickettsia endosymbiont of Ixodes persulcatus]|nr:transposase [Rickettsia endosymbiont of Ixodes persulcatus]